VNSEAAELPVGVEIGTTRLVTHIIHIYSWTTRLLIVVLCLSSLISAKVDVDNDALVLKVALIDVA
jgi:hypothetical protein